MNHGGSTDDRFRQLVELAPDAMLGVAVDGRIVWRTPGPNGCSAGSARISSRGRSSSCSPMPCARPTPAIAPPSARTRAPARWASASTRPRGARGRLDVPGGDQPRSARTPRRTGRDRRRPRPDRAPARRGGAPASRSERAEAEIASRTKDQFLATLSHELHTPLQAILGWVRMLRSGSLDETVAARALETIERNARIQARLIDDLLDVSRIVSGKVQLDCRIVELPLVIDAAIDAVRATAYARRIRLHADRPGRGRGVGRSRATAAGGRQPGLQCRQVHPTAARSRCGSSPAPATRRASS